jgi:colanic acid/amylovoran biosynthesis glycosyltransferase
MVALRADDDSRPVVAHVNYMYFASTQSFIYFYLSKFRRTRPVCLTRAPESPSIRRNLPESLAPDFYLYGAEDQGNEMSGPLWSAGLALRRVLTRCPPRIAVPVLNALHRRIVPHFRRDDDPERYVRWVVSILERRRARILHAYFGPVAWRMLEAKRRLGIPMVVSFLGDDVAPTLGAWWWWLVRQGPGEVDWPARLRELFEEADLLLVEGPYLRQRLVGLGCAPDKVAVQRIALPLDEMPPVCAGAKRSRGKRVILFAARLCEQKGALYALEAIARLWSERQDFEFRIVGDDTLTDGSYASRVRAAARSRKLRDCVRMLGFLNRDEYLREIAGADIFLHPSITDKDGYGEGGAPTAILEAQALGVPVVATTHCDIPNVTVDGETALLVPERDAAALVDALRILLEDPQRCERMGAAGRRFIEEHHDASKEAVLLEDRYETLLAPS